MAAVDRGVRYDERTERYRDCRWCQGKGCIYCKSEADKAYKAMFPDGPQPIATFDLTTEEGKKAARDFIGNLTGVSVAVLRLDMPLTGERTGHIATDLVNLLLKELARE